jgi:hypothetical protein
MKNHYVDIEVGSNDHTSIENIVSKLIPYASGLVISVELETSRIDCVDVYFTYNDSGDGDGSRCTTQYANTYRLWCDTDTFKTKSENEEIIFNELVIMNL